MSADVRHDAEDLEPELRAAGKAPPKKPLAEFLAEFEERLASHPDEPATGAMRAIEERAGGLRRTPAEAPPTRYATEAVEIPVEAVPVTAAADEAVDVPPGVAEPTAESTSTEVSGESRHLRGRRRRKHRHKAR